MRRFTMNSRGWSGPVILLVTVIGTGGGLAAWKYASTKAADAAAASQPEPVEAVTAAVARERQHRQTTTSIGTVRALKSVTLRNEVAGTVRRATLTPGQVVEAGTILVALDVSVEVAELKEQETRSVLAEAMLGRMERLGRESAVPAVDVDRARAERDAALAAMARTRAIIARKTIRAPFRARVGISDVHPGQYLEEGALLTTLQGVEQAAHVDFTVAQRVASGLREGENVSVFTGDDAAPVVARIVAIDARVDPVTRNALVRARIAKAAGVVAPGASVRVVVPVGPLSTAVVVPVSALRKGPGGDHVFVIQADSAGSTRVRVRSVASGTVLGDEVLILSGLSAGEQVAASGSFKLREGVQVAVAARPTEQPTEQ